MAEICIAKIFVWNNSEGYNYVWVHKLRVA